MAIRSKIDSNVTSLSIAAESSTGVLPGSPTWIAMQPNSYGQFGGSLSKTARNPISLLRQARKGVTTDLDAAAEFEQDITMYSFSDLWPGLFQANKRNKPQVGGRTNTAKVNAVTATGYDLGTDAAAAGFQVGMLVHTEFFGVANNNTLSTVRVITAISGDEISVSGTAIEASPPSDAIIRSVGFQFDVDDIDMERPASDFPRLAGAGGKDLASLPLIPGETIVVGELRRNLTSGGAANRFNNDGNNGKFRIRSIDSSDIIFDQSDGGSTGLIEPTAEATSGKSIRIFWADVVRNVAADDADFNQLTYTIERSLGAPDDAAASEIQAETVTGALWNGAGIELPTADKMVVSAEFLATENTNYRGTSGDERPTFGETVLELQESDAFNTTDNVPDIRIFRRSLDPAAIVPSAFFGFVSDLSINVSNNATTLKSIGQLGAFAVTVGNFTAQSDMTAYFQTTDALQAVRENDDIGFYAFMKQSLNGRNAGFLIDQPFGSTTTDGLNVEGDGAVTAPLTFDAAVDPNYLFTMILHEFWFLPN